MCQLCFTTKQKSKEKMTNRTVILSSTGVLLLAIFVTYAFILVSQQHSFYELTIQEKSEMVRKQIEKIPHEVYGHYRTRLRSFTNSRKEIIKAFAQRDRQKLLGLSTPLHDILKKENSFFITLAFILPDSTVFLRSFKPQFHGDNAGSFSKMIEQANREQKPYAGFEILQRGLGYRLVHPVFYEQHYVGLITFVIDGGHFFKSMKDHGMGEVGIYFPENTRTASAFDLRDEKFKTYTRQEMVPYVFQTSSPLLQDLPPTTDLDLPEQSLRLAGRETILLGDFTVHDFQQSKLCNLLLALDISTAETALRRTLLNTIVFGLFLGLLALLVIYLGVGSLMGEIVKLNKALKVRVKDRTNQLQQESLKRQQSQEIWEKTVNALDEIVVFQDNEHKIVQSNRAAEGWPDLQLDDLLAGQSSGASSQSTQQEIFVPAINRELQIRSLPIFNEEGSLFGQVHILKDITDEKRSREQKQKEEKMDLLGQMAGGVAHDLNNILAPVINYPELLLMRMEEESPYRSSLETIRSSGLRAAEVVADMLTITRGAGFTREVTRLHQLIAAFSSSPELQKLQSKVEKNVQVETRLQAEHDLVSCSALHIRKILMNLASNAIEAQQGEGVVTITTSNRRVEFSGLNLPDKLGDYLVLEVSDSGPGIAEKDLEHIFDPFYTKKQLGRSTGTGLGLTVVWNSVHNHDGSIFVTSSSAGTVFTIYLPLAQGEARELPHPEPHPSLPGQLPMGNGETVLIVDDEELLREIPARFLSSLNYKCKSVASGEAAVAFVKENQVDLLLLDMIMGSGLNGRQTYEEILKTNPEQRALIASGYSESADVKKALAIGVGGFIMKPYDRAKLARAVYRILHSD